MYYVKLLSFCYTALTVITGNALGPLSYVLPYSVDVGCVCVAPLVICGVTDVMPCLRAVAVFFPKLLGQGVGGWVYHAIYLACSFLLSGVFLAAVLLCCPTGTLGHKLLWAYLCMCLGDTVWVGAKWAWSSTDGSKKKAKRKVQ